MAEIYRDDLRARFGQDLDLDGELPDDPWLRQVLLRRTQRHYADRPVPESLVRLLLAAAFSASSKSDFQQASVIWLKDRGRRDRLAALFPDMPWIGAAPVFLVFLGDARRLEKIGALRGLAPDNGALEGFFNAAIDAALAVGDRMARIAPAVISVDRLGQPRIIVAIDMHCRLERQTHADEALLRRVAEAEADDREHLVGQREDLGNFGDAVAQDADRT